MPVIDGIYTKDFPDLGRDGLGTDLIPVALTGDNVTYKVTLSALLALYQLKLGGTGLVKSAAGTISYLADPLPGANGGTGVANTGKTITLGGNLTTSGAFAITLTATAITGVTLPTSGTLYGTQAGSFNSLALKTSLTDETGAGAAVFANAPTLVDPVLGNALATTVNGVTITPVSPAATLTLGNNSTFITAGAFSTTLTSTGTTNVTLPTSGTLATTAYADALVSDVAYNATTWNGVTGIAPSKNAVRDIISGLMDSTVAFTTPNIGAATGASLALSGTLGISGGTDNVKGGTYTPTLTNGTNVSASTARLSHYTRIGNEVTVTGVLDVSTTGSGGSVIDVSLPIASNLGTVYDLSGVGSIDASAWGPVWANGSVANDRAVITFVANTGGAVHIYFTFTYTVI